MVTDDEIISFLAHLQSIHISGGHPPDYTHVDDLDALGVCRYTHARTGSSTYRIGDISVHPEMMRHPLLIKGVLWHEYCHHMEWQLKGTSGHAEAFRRYYEKEPWYALLNTIALIFIKI